MSSEEHNNCVILKATQIMMDLLKGPKLIPLTNCYFPFQVPVEQLFRINYPKKTSIYLQKTANRSFFVVALLYFPLIGRGDKQGGREVVPEEATNTWQGVL